MLSRGEEADFNFTKSGKEQQKINASISPGSRILVAKCSAGAKELDTTSVRRRW